MDRSAARGTLLALVYVTSLFLAWAFVTSNIDPLVAAVKAVFVLNTAESMLTQFAWFIAYGIASLPAAALLARFGYANSIVGALATMVLGCLIVPLATAMDAYVGVLLALFVIASGVTLLQVAANPLVAGLGKPESAHFRLTFAQAFNSLGTVLGSYIGASIMLKGGVFEAGAANHAIDRIASLRAIDKSFLMIGGFAALLAVFIWTVRKRIAAAAPASEGTVSPWQAFGSKWALFGALAIFLYVGAEVSIGSAMVNFLVDIRFVEHLTQTGALKPLEALGLVSAASPTAETAGKLLGLFYWGGAMVGRFVGSALLTRVKAGVLLTVNATIAVLLCLYVTQAHGPGAGFAALAVGFFNSIMFPTIFTLTLDKSTASVPATSGLLCMAIIGGAFLPYATGHVADLAGFNVSFWVPLAGYVGIAVFAFLAARAKGRGDEVTAAPGSALH